MRIITFLAALLALSVAAPGWADVSGLDELPAGALSHSEMGPASEFVLYVTLDPALIKGRLPPGLRYRTLEEMSAKSPEIAEYLASHPERRTWVHTYFEIIGSPHMVYDGVAARFGATGGMAVWYAPVVRLDKSDKRPRGFQQVALGTWLSDAGLVRHMTTMGYPAETARIVFRRDADGKVTGALDAKGLKVRAGCRLEGRSFSPDWAKAGTYQTMWTPAGGSPTFELVTYRGHVVEDCLDARWTLSGTNPLATAWRTRATGGRQIDDTEFASGYVLKGALYPR
jgi:hypothetical protein